VLLILQDFKKLGVFDAQKALEEKHRKEEDELYQQMFDERRNQVEQLDQLLIVEREQTVRELVAWFEQQGLSGQERDIGLTKVRICFIRCSARICELCHSKSLLLLERFRRFLQFFVLRALLG
jgi:hypothetical protein